MTVAHKTTRAQMKEIRRLLRADLVQYGERVASAFALKVTAEFEKIFAFANESGSGNTPKPHLAVESRVYMRNDVLVIRTKTRVEERGTGKAHEIFYHLNFGVKPGFVTTSYPLGPIRERNGTTTSARSLKITPFKGYSGNLIYLYPGAYVKGIEPREWTRLIAEKVKSEMAGDSDYNGWSVSYTDVAP